jgi:hypothetical protein
MEISRLSPEQKILGTVTISLAGMLHLKKFKYENVHKMKNKPDPALLQSSYLSIEIKKRITKSHETRTVTCYCQI